MKYRTTAKAVRNGYGTVYSIGYCEMQALLWYSEPVAYTCGVYGWNADVYAMPGNVAICTGYRPTGKNASWDLVKKYEDEARAIVDDWGIPYEQKKARVSALLADLLGDLRAA